MIDGTPRWGPLARSRGARATMGAGLATAIVCAFLPLADHLGFEFGGVLAIVLAMVAPAAGVAAARLEHGRIDAERRPIRAAWLAVLVSWIAIGLAAGVILLNGLRRPSCDASGGSAWLFVLAAPSAALGASVGALARFALGGTRRAIVAIALVEIAALSASLSTIYAGPSFFLFDHFFGYFPGPLYDEVVEPRASVLAFRTLTLGWAAAAAIACGAFGGRRNAASALAALGLVVALTSVSLGWGEEIGFRTTSESISHALGGERRVDGLELHFPREWAPDHVERFVEDAKFRSAQVRTALGVTADPVRVWLYRSPDEKRRLVGAGPTSFAKPWRREIHIHASTLPHPVLRHELVHAYGASLAGGPFHVPGGYLPNTPLIEGFAVAFDLDPEGGTLDEWAKAMRELKLAPDVRALLSARGFLASAPARAYTYAGAFIRFLEARQGREAVLKLYAAGDLAAAGDPKALVAAFEQHLDEDVALSADTRAAAERRYARPSVFRRTCAREVSALSDDVRERLARGETTEALEAAERACELEPDDPALLRAAMSTAIAAKDASAREAYSARLFAHPKVDASLRAGALVELGDDAWRAGDTSGAHARYAEAARLVAEPQTRRNAVVRAAVVRDEALAPAVKPIFLEGKADVPQLFELADYVRAHPEDAIARYLLGRQLVQRDAHAHGARLLEEAIANGLEDAQVSLEAHRLLVRALAQEGRCDRAEALVTGFPGGASDRRLARDWVERCRFAR